MWVILPELANQIIDRIESKSKIVYRPLLSDDPRQRKPNIEPAKEKLDWEPQIKLRDEIDKNRRIF
jgi:UDP-glucuronate decarboxylase